MQPIKIKSKKNIRSGAMSSTLRCLQVFELLAEEPFELSVSDIAKSLSMPRASVHRLCTTLVEGGFVEHAPVYKRYRLTSKSLWVGFGYLRHSAIYRAAFFPMQTLAKQIPGFVTLGVLSEGKVLFIYSVGLLGFTEAFADIGLRRPLHATAAGKLFLADMPLDKVEKLMSHRVEKYTKRTTVSFTRMKKELAQIAARGYAVNDEELVPGYVILAAPIFDSARNTIGTINVILPVKLANPKKTASYVQLLCEAAHQTSLQMGFNPHTNSNHIR